MTDYVILDKELDRTKVKVFLSKNAAFLGALMSSLNFMWAEDVPTACTNGSYIKWNPTWFLKIPKETRKTVLLHEIWHVALFHMLRINNRDPKIWNWACDIYINDMLCLEGYTFDGTYPWISDYLNNWKHPTLYTPVGDFVGMNVEDIYDILIQQIPPIDSDNYDLIEPEDKKQIQEVVNAVVQASAAAAIGGSLAGNTPGEVETLLKNFLQPKLPWEQLLMQFFNELSEADYSWARPNRRYQDMYLPSMMPSEGLEHIRYYIDVSGSISDGMVIRCNSEIKYIKETFNPITLTIILFDTKIQKTITFNQDDPFDEIVIVGRGGTDLRCVHDDLIDTKPNAAIIFTDLEVTPMEKLPIEIPIIWIGVNASTSHKINMGKVIYIRE